MKKQLFILLCIFSGLSLFAQNTVNLVIFSEDGDPFYAYVNGVKQNVNPETNVKVAGLSPNISLRIEFADKTLPQLKQAMALDPGFEHTARIKRDMKKQLKLRYFGRVPLAEASTDVPTVQYHTATDDQSAYNTAGGNTQSDGNVNTTITTSSTTTTTKSNSNPDNGSMSINMGSAGINMNVSGFDNGSGATMNTTTSTTVTSTQSSSGSQNSDSYNNQSRTGNGGSYEHHSKGGCSAAMSPSGFSAMKQSIESKPFSDTKMSTAKIATKNACLSLNQVKEICKLFTMDDDKLTYAKYAYDHCVEKANYYQVSEVFSFSATTEDFNKFLEQ